MYAAESFRVARSAGRTRSVSRNVIFLGLTSFFTDVSSEMVSTILPIYLVLHLHLTPLQFGIVDGLYQGMTTLLRVAGGFVADRWRRHKEVAATGYALSALCRVALPAAGAAWTQVAGVIAIDRTGKGLRTAPRDALISLSTPVSRLATAFGVHRAFDGAGAMLGPLVGFAILAAAPGRFDAVFVASFCAALMGLAVMIFFVENRAVCPRTDVPADVGRDVGPAEHRCPRQDLSPALHSHLPNRCAMCHGATAGSAAGPVSLAAVLQLFRDSRFLWLMVAGGLLGLTTVSDAFAYLALQRKAGFAAHLLPLVYVATALVYVLLAVPVGRLADRAGRRPVFIAGYVALALVYAVILFSAALGNVAVAATIALIGLYYAATDGVLAALASAILPQPLRASGLAIVSTAIGLARMIGSIAFGAMWTTRGVEASLALFAMCLIVTIGVAVFALMRVSEEPAA